MLPPMSARLRIDIIWTDEDRIRLLVNDRDVWQGGWEVIDLLQKLEELDYIVLTLYDDESDYTNRARQ